MVKNFIYQKLDDHWNGVVITDEVVKMVRFNRQCTVYEDTP